jgi:hypothetical protein
MLDSRHQIGNQTLGVMKLGSKIKVFHSDKLISSRLLISTNNSYFPSFTFYNSPSYNLLFVAKRHNYRLLCGSQYCISLRFIRKHPFLHLEMVTKRCGTKIVCI